MLSVSAGAGHTRAAEAIRQYALQHDDAVTAVHLDVMQFVPKSFQKIYTEFYIQLVNRAPALWGYLYQASHEGRPDSATDKLRRGIERVNTAQLRKVVLEEAPDAIICTHFLPAEILCRMIRQERLSCPLWVQVTDFDLHRLWVQPQVAGYFVANAELAYRLRRLGVAEESIHLTGIPIVPAFAEPPSRRECAAELGLDAARTTILLMGGGAGLGGLDSLARQLLSGPGDFQLLVLAGRNREALAALEALTPEYPQRLFAQGFSNQVERLMACADLVITKPGGLTSSECLAMGLPMILNSPIPGQEEHNADFLLEQGVAWKALDAISLAYKVGELMQHPERLDTMRARARALGKPLAGRQVVETVIARLEGVA